jgi:hypothetical protein
MATLMLTIIGLERLEAIQQLPEVAYPGVYPLITLFCVSFELVDPDVALTRV